MQVKPLMAKKVKPKVATKERGVKVDGGSLAKKSCVGSSVNKNHRKIQNWKIPGCIDS
jgi:hypothetical protein